MNEQEPPHQLDVIARRSAAALSAAALSVGKVTDQRSPSFGYDAQTDEYGDLIKKGIIDPAKVVRVALQDASSVAGLLVTTEARVKVTSSSAIIPQAFCTA